MGINNEVVEQQCNTIIDNAKFFNQSILEYLFSFVPEELRQQLGVFYLSGCFATNVAGKSSLNADLNIYLENKTLRLKFDNINKCLYHTHWRDEDSKDLLDKYFKYNYHFDCWIKEL